MKRFDKRILSLSVGIALAGISGSAAAAFFQIQETSVSGLGNAYAGGSAIAEDASTVWYNPAGMTRLKGRQLIAAGHIIIPSTEFSKDSATTLLGGQMNGGNGGDAGETAFVPSFFYTQALTEQWVFGLGVSAPFGLATDYDDDWVGRYHADRSEIKTVNINPSIAFRFNDAFSVGAGVSYQHIDAQLSQFVDFGLICATTLCAGAVVGEAPQAQDGHANIEADDNSFGYNLGLLWEFSNDTRVGFAYRSPVRHKLKGTQDIDASGTAGTIAGIVGVSDTDANARVKLPATVSLSGFHQVSSQWGVMGDITQTRWADLPELRIQFESGQSDSIVTLNSKNALRYSMGATYAANSTWTYRAGIALDKSPVPNAEDRTPRLPDEDRIWLALGAGYKMKENLSADFAFVHIVIDDADINKVASGSNENATRGNLRGTYEANVNIVSAQINWKF